MVDLLRILIALVGLAERQSRLDFRKRDSCEAQGAGKKARLCGSPGFIDEEARVES